jgi:sarcosine oxidase, subunit gamma
MNRDAAAWLAAPAGARRTGLKGPNAAQMLAGLGIEVPAKPNTWTSLDAPGDAGSPNVVCRLGASEFFLEEAGDASRVAALEERLASGGAGAWPVLREDTALLLGGPAADAVLAEVCNLNFAAQDLDARPVSMTLMIGVSVLVLPQAAAAGRIFRIWCDPTYGPYLGTELEEIVERISTGRAQ